MFQLNTVHLFINNRLKLAGKLYRDVNIFKIKMKRNLMENVQIKLIENKEVTFKTTNKNNYYCVN